MGGADDAVKFMTKVREACDKWYVKDENVKKVEEEMERRALLSEDEAGNVMSLDQARASGAPGGRQPPTGAGPQEQPSGLILWAARDTYHAIPYAGARERRARMCERARH